MGKSSSWGNVWGYMMIGFGGELFPSLVASVFRENDDFEGWKVMGTYIRGGSGIVVESELGVDGEDTQM